MTKTQREYKEANRRRRQVELTLQALPKPRSKTSQRRRFEEVHDAWRKAVGLPQLLRTGPLTKRTLHTFEMAYEAVVADRRAACLVTEAP